ncbi:MAG: hypothetical protein V4714_10400 [Bacteroidota bacterium]
MLFLRILAYLVVFVLLTVVTQVGGIIYLLCFPVFRWLNTQIKRRPLRSFAKASFFVLVYAFCSLVIVPPVAARFGRVPMPTSMQENNPVKPLNKLTCFLNRHYVRKPLRALVSSVAVEMRHQYPGTIIVYLDSGFPFWNGFPLAPHLSHNDGKKIDLAFFYLDSQTKERINGEAPAWLGYGICEAPRPGEVDRPRECEQQGYWQYSWLSTLVPHSSNPTMVFDPIRTRELVRLFALHTKTGKLFIEPHLKIRLGLNYPKIRLHGCKAVRHDDHLHLQIK